jgi:hypothetical protein
VPMLKRNSDLITEYVTRAVKLFGKIYREQRLEE